MPPGPYDDRSQDYDRQRELYAKIRKVTLSTSPFSIDDRTLPEDPERSYVFQQIKSALDGQRMTDFLLATVMVILVVIYFQVSSLCNRGRQRMMRTDAVLFAGTLA